MAYQFRTLEKTGSIDNDRVLLYPKARHTTEPWLIAYTPASEKIGELLERNDDLRKRALELGFRVSGDRSLNDELQARGMATPQLNETESFMPKSTDLARVYLAPIGDPEDRSQVRVECEVKLLPDKKSRPKGPFVGVCLGRVLSWEDPDLTIRPIAIFL